jgi:hypothetical protein
MPLTPSSATYIWSETGISTEGGGEGVGGKPKALRGLKKLLTIFERRSFLT